MALCPNNTYNKYLFESGMILCQSQEVHEGEKQRKKQKSTEKVKKF